VGWRDGDRLTLTACAGMLTERRDRSQFQVTRRRLPAAYPRILTDRSSLAA
jgi:hypothetical protein